MNLFNAIVFVFLLAIGNSTSCFAQATPARDYCNNVARDIKVGDNSTYIQVVECHPVDPAKSFGLRYVWLDATNMSFLLAGHSEKVLDQIVGKPAIVLKNGMYERLSSLFRDFGERVTKNGFPVYSYYQNRLTGDRSNNIDSTTNFDDVSESVRRRLRFFAGEEPIIWPEASVSRSIANTKEWPDSWRMTYRDRYDGSDGPVRKDSDALHCVVLYNFVTQDEAKKYWDSSENLRAAIADKSVSKNYATPAIAPIHIYENRLFNLGHRGLQAIQAAAGGSWKPDFLLRFGTTSIDGCGGNRFGLYAHPRRMFVLVAIISAIGPSISLNGLEYKVDTNTELRSEAKETTQITERFPEQTLRRGQSLVIPLRMELRYDFDDEPFSRLLENPISNTIYENIVKLNRRQFSVSSSGTVWMTKLKSSFRAPEFTKVTRSYVSGEARSLAAVILDDNPYPVKPAPRTALVAVGEFDGGSCPFLLVRENDGDWSLHGRVLVGADHQDRARIERIALPLGSLAIRLEEREPEVSYIKKISVRNADGTEVLLAENITIGPSLAFEVSLPASENGARELEIEGYYRQLNRIQP